MAVYAISEQRVQLLDANAFALMLAYALYARDNKNEKGPTGRW